MKLIYSTKLEIEFDNEDELMVCLRNLPNLRTQLGASGSAQSNIKRLESDNILQLSSLDEPQKDAIIKALEACKTKRAAADFLGITRCTLNSKIKQYGI